MSIAHGPSLCTPIHGARLLLQPLTHAHADQLFQPMQSDAIYQWTSMPKPSSVDALRERWRRSETRLSPDGTEVWLAWLVTLHDSGTAIGKVDAVMDDHGVCTNFGYFFFPAFWGQGLATEAVTAAAEHLVRSGVQRLVATVTVGNHASCKVLEKAGFAFARRIPDNDTIRGELVDDEEYVRIV